MTRTSSLRAPSLILPYLRTAGGWLLVLMVLALALPTAWSFTPSPPGREIQLEPSAADFGAELPGALLEAAGQQKQPLSHFESLLFTCVRALTTAPTETTPAGLTFASLPRITAHTLTFSARPPPRA